MHGGGVKIFFDPQDLARCNRGNEQKRRFDHAIIGVALKRGLLDEAAGMIVHPHVLVLLVPESLGDRQSTRLNSSHECESTMTSSAGNTKKRRPHVRIQN